MSELWMNPFVFLDYQYCFSVQCILKVLKCVPVGVAVLSLLLGGNIHYTSTSMALQATSPGK